MKEKNRVMIVEDEAIIAMDIKSDLEGMDYIVPCMASSGEEALSKIDECKPDIILMDIKIAGDMDGIETARKINKQHNIPIIYITSYSDEKTLERAMDTRPYSYILKPIRERDLAVEIKMALHSHKMELKLIAAYNEVNRSFEELKMLDTLKKEAVTSISRDLQTHIRAASEAITVAMSDQDRKVKEKSLIKAKKELLNQTRMIDNIISEANIMLKGLTISTSVFNLKEVVSSVIEDVKSEVEEKGIKIETEAQDIFVKADYYKIKHVISLLLKKAIRSSHEGGELKVLVKEGDYIVEISVSNEGVEIPAEGQERIFDSTFDLEAVVFEPTSRGEFKEEKSDVMGVKDIIVAHKGNVGVESGAGKGTRFFFELPLGND